MLDATFDTCGHTEEFARILDELDISLLISTGRSGQLLLLSAPARRLQIRTGAYDRPIGIAVTDDAVAVATNDEIILLDPRVEGNNHEFGDPDDHPSLIDKERHYSGEMDIHDLAWGPDGLWMVNTKCGCLCSADDNFQITNRWQPPFITDSRPEDRCHLNGLAMQDGQPIFTTALGATDTPKGWRPGRSKGGVLMHVPTGEIILEGLSMPHSPRMFDERLYFLNAGTGELVVVDPERRTMETVIRLPGFARGLARTGDYLFVGLSKLRRSRTLRDLPLDDKEEELMCGIGVLHFNTGELKAILQLDDSYEELYDVHVLPHTAPKNRFPGDADLHRTPAIPG